jgi:SAM-dependent methyltransferase
MTNLWSNNDFAQKYALASNSDVNSFETQTNEASIISLIRSSTETILDYGCSSGHLVNRLTGKYRQVVGYDIAKSARLMAKESFPDINITGKIDGEFDCIILKLVLHLIENPKSLLKRLSEYLTDEGYFIISLPHPIDDAMNLGIAYDRMDQICHEKEIGGWKPELKTTMYWRTMKYWIKLFNDLGFVMTSVDEPLKDGPIPKRLNARFEKKIEKSCNYSTEPSGSYYYFKYGGH